MNANPQNFPGAQPQGGLHINGANVKVNFGKEAGLSRSVMEVVKKGGTRNLYLSGVMVNEDLENGAVCNVGADGIAIRSFRMETIQQDFARFLFNNFNINISLGLVN